MPLDDILLDAEERMEKAVDVFRHSLTGIRTGRANPGLVDTLRVEVYGSPTPIKALASVGAPEPNQIVVRPFDPTTIKDIEKAIQASDLGLNPQSDGRLIRIIIAGQGHAYEPGVKVILVLWVGLLALIGWLSSIGLWRQSRLASTVG